MKIKTTKNGEELIAISYPDIEVAIKRQPYMLKTLENTLNRENNKEDKPKRQIKSSNIYITEDNTCLLKIYLERI